MNYINLKLDKIKNMIININMNIKLPEICPFCGGKIQITELKCETCNAVVSGSFNLGSFSISDEHWEFIRLFIKVRGNLKKMGKILGLSYPTLRARLEEVREVLGFLPSEDEKDDVISELEMGLIDTNEALKKLEESN